MKNRIILEYSLISLVVTVCIALVVSKIIISSSTRFTMDQHASFLIEYLDSIPTNYPELAESLDSDNEPDEHDVDHFLRDLFLFPSIVHIRISKPNGELLWELLRHDPMHEILLLEDLIDISSDKVHIRLVEASNDSNPILSVFYPVRIEGRTVAYVEVIDADQQVHRQLADSRRRILLTVASAGLAYYVLLFSLFYLSYLRLRRTNKRLEQTQEVTIRTMSRLAELRDSETGAHIDRTSHYCEVLAMELRKTEQYAGYISRRYVDDLKRSAPLHDIGKVGVPDSVLNKPGALSEDEWFLMRQHPTMGGRILSQAIEELDFQSYFEIGLQVVLGHHENWDGSGYPDGISGTQIPLSARIMALADVYDALRTERPYKAPMSHEHAVQHIISERGKKFDPDIVDAFTASQDLFYEISNSR